MNTHPKFQKLVVKKLSKISRRALRPTYDLRNAMWSTLAMSVASSGLRKLGLELIRNSNDLRLPSSGPNYGLAEIDLPSLQHGSSITRGKINPVMVGLIAKVGFQAIGADMVTAAAVQAR